MERRENESSPPQTIRAESSVRRSVFGMARRKTHLTNSLDDDDRPDRTYGQESCDTKAAVEKRNGKNLRSHLADVHADTLSPSPQAQRLPAPPTISSSTSSTSTLSVSQALPLQADKPTMSHPFTHEAAAQGSMNFFLRHSHAPIPYSNPPVSLCHSSSTVSNGGVEGGGDKISSLIREHSGPHARRASTGDSPTNSKEDQIRIADNDPVRGANFDPNGVEGEKGIFDVLEALERQRLLNAAQVTSILQLVQ
jgi:hypothetical protein